MVKKSRIAVEMGSGNKVRNYMYLNRKNIQDGYDYLTKKEIDHLEEEMAWKILEFEFEGDLMAGLGTIKLYQLENEVSWMIFNEAVHAKQNEFGTHERWIYIEDKPKVIDWILTYLDVDDPYKMGILQLGGSGSRIKLGASKNKFFFNTIDEYKQSNPKKRFAQDIEKFIKKTK
jgi:hypothetical protein